MTQLAFLRLAIFVATLVLTGAATRWGATALILIAAAGFSAFIITVIAYVAMQRRVRKDESLVHINENEIRALQGDYSMFDSGDEFNDPEHPFASDLDIFGPLGLFQFLNRSATHSGRKRLAEWFRNPFTDIAIIRRQQEAVKELAGKLEFRQEFLAGGHIEKEQPDDKAELLAWLEEKPVFSSRNYLFLLIFIPVLTFTVIFLAAFSIINPTWILLYLAVPFGITGRKLATINRKYRMLTKKSAVIRKYSALLQIMENETFATDRLRELKEGLAGEGGMPSHATRKLSRILDAFDTRNNMLMGFLLNFLFLWDIRQVRRSEQWLSMHKDDLPRWLEIVAETDALCSLANFHFNNPESIFPTLDPEEHLILAEALAHPLIPEAIRIANPAKILCRRHFIIVSGANMAGKSTYLRTVGVSMVMAMTGSAVIAERMTFFPAAMITSIRTRDSLQKNESYFYAELKRLKYIIERLEQGEKLLILLDEILKGTNSRDKQSGSIALLEKLLGYGATGLIATHDLALGELEKTYPENISNKSFEVVIENDLLVFDYKLKDGIARQMNATFLMKKMGITD
jgi:hypothetical protein